MNNTIRVLQVAILLSVGTLAFGHNYLPSPSQGTVTYIPDIAVSRAAYRELKSDQQVDVYEFAAREGQQIYVQMTVPVLERQADFAPVIVLQGPGGDLSFPAPDVQGGTILDAPHVVVDTLHPHDDGDAEVTPLALAVAWDGKGPTVFDEPFTGTRYWIRQTVTVLAPVDGTYRIGIYSAEGSTGKYVLATGREEKFTAADLLGFPGVRLAVRTFCEVPVWPDILVWSALGVAAAAGLGFGIAALLAL